MLRTFRYPLHPTVAQAATLDEWRIACQQMYNAALQHRRDAQEHEKLQRQAAEDRGCKAEEAGKWAVPVDPRGTSQHCSQCGARVPKDLSVRTHSCPACGLVLGRDLNAARNILALGRSAVAGVA